MNNYDYDHQRLVMGEGYGIGLGSVPTVPTYKSTPDSSWDCSMWMIWHKALVSAFTAGSFQSGIKYSQAKAIENANNVFVVHWNKSAGIYNRSFCGYSSDFFSYFKLVGLTDILSYFQAVVTPTANTAANVVSSTTKAVENVAHATENVSEAAQNTASVTKWLVPVVLVTIVGGVLYFGFKNPSKIIPGVGSVVKRKKVSKKSSLAL